MSFNRSVASRYEDWYYSWWGRKFDRLEKRLLRKSLKGIEGKSLLEVDCGTGYFTRWFQALGIRAVGLDISREMLSVAQIKSRKKIPLCQARAESLPFKAEAFNRVVMITALEFVYEPEAALAEALRVSKDKIALGMLNSRSFLSFFYKIKRALKKSSYEGAHLYSIREMKSLIYKVAEDNNISLAKVSKIKTDSLVPFYRSFFVLEVEKGYPLRK